MSATTDDSTAEACSFWDAGRCAGTPYCPPRCPRFVDKYGEGLLVRPFEASDREALSAMYRDYAPEHRSMGLPPVTPGRIDEWLDRLLERGRNFVARDGDAVIGHAAYSPRSDDEPEFVVFVHQDSHDRGVGSELTRHAIADAAAAGHAALLLDVAFENERARHVYRKLGFEEVPSSSTDVRMRLSLDHPTASAVRRPPAGR
jgi:GNAT superfamily N-acetyltransferase